ncbi:hypothetical protein [Paenibacillus polymyxa]|uniref:hypothetical protein n=1 Tax=Paenibacillus polymyxa TaxID=1406 RepID=UPI002035888B|nr:hypothetical protein [Paenibacillus polymyxa]
MGITRFFPGIVDSSAAIKENHLYPQEEELYRALFYKNTQTSNMNKEVRMIKQNAVKVAKGGIPDVPMYFFISNGEELPVEDWQTYLIRYIESVKMGQYQVLNSGDYIHNTHPDRIADESMQFINEL